MSYEGSEQCICVNGHYYEMPCQYGGYNDPCPMCRGECAWLNSINDTNCDSVGEIPMELLKERFLISEEVVEECNLGHRHVTSPAIFRIPKDGEADDLRHWRDHDGKMMKLDPRAGRTR